MRILEKATLALMLMLLPAALWADTKVIPAGSEVYIRTNEAIDSKTAQAGQTVSAVVERDVVDSSGVAVIPKGSPAQLVLRQVSSGGTFGSSGLTLDLESVTLNGQRYMVNTEDVRKSSRKGIGKNRRTAEMVGGGAALGTLIGAVAGGGKGAILGGLLGATAGGTAQVLTKGHDTKIPAESVLTFRLNQALQLEAR